MKSTVRFWRVWLVLGCWLSVVGCHSIPKNTVTQISTIDALLAGAYDGQMPCAKLATLGNFGIGTFDGLDGEMVFLDREVYQVKSDGLVYRPNGQQTTPFASVVEFQNDKKWGVWPGTDYVSFQQLVDAASSNTNLLCAVKFEGSFRHIQTRSVPAQTKPYPPLVEVTKHQPVFDYDNIEGTLVGFRLPSFVKGVNVPGYHVHFLSKDHRVGGHVLSFNIEQGFATVNTCHRFVMILPQGESVFNGIDFKKDRSHELEKAEK